MEQKKLISTSATAAIALVLAYWLVSKTKKKDHGDIPSPWPALPIVGKSIKKIVFRKDI
jgi:hypothetical protein